MTPSHDPRCTTRFLKILNRYCRLRNSKSTIWKASNIDSKSYGESTYCMMCRKNDIILSSCRWFHIWGKELMKLSARCLICHEVHSVEYLWMQRLEMVDNFWVDQQKQLSKACPFIDTAATNRQEKYATCVVGNQCLKRFNLHIKRPLNLHTKKYKVEKLPQETTKVSGVNKQKISKEK